MRLLSGLLSASLLLTACVPAEPAPPDDPASSASSSAAPVFQRVDFTDFHPSLKFSAEVPARWEVEFLPQITAINIYDPAAPGEKPREQSRLFIHQFTANDFQTLSVVDVSLREETTVNGHAAVRYEITKKPIVGDFASQPPWRNRTHRLIDIRFKETRPSIFYVFAYAPDVPEEVFEAFIQSLRFIGDTVSSAPASVPAGSALLSPLERFAERVTKKPFGIRITRATSPVQPERFSGYHTGTDFEIEPGEEDETIAVRAICDGKVKLARDVDGYGGLMVQSCVINGETVNVLYGHIAFSLSSIQIVPETELQTGQVFATLGEGYSDETDGERKHLHLAIHKGSSMVLAGYVQSEDELKNWIDPMSVLPR